MPIHHGSSIKQVLLISREEIRTQAAKETRADWEALSSEIPWMRSTTDEVRNEFVVGRYARHLEEIERLNTGYEVPEHLSTFIEPPGEFVPPGFQTIRPHVGQKQADRVLDEDPTPTKICFQCGKSYTTVSCSCITSDP